MLLHTPTVDIKPGEIKDYNIVGKKYLFTPSKRSLICTKTTKLLGSINDTTFSNNAK